MSGGRFNLSTLQELSNSGLLQSGSRLRFRPAGSTTTLQDTYSNPSLTTPNANPIVADSYGRFTTDIYMSDLPYRVEVLPPAGNDTPVMTFDPVYKDRVIIQAAAAPANPWPDMEYVNTTDLRRYRRNRANSAWVDLGPYDGVGNVAAKSDVVAASSATLFVTPDALEAIWGKGSDIPSAATLTIPASEGGYFIVTGNTGITNISAAVSGREICLRFTGAPLVTSGANLVLGVATLQVVAGDILTFRYDSGVWYLTNVNRLSGSPLNLTDFIASQSDMETATDLTKVVTAGRAHNHPGVAKCWGQFNFAGVISASYNITSITDTGTGRVTVTIGTDFSSATWSCVQGIGITSGGATGIGPSWISKAAGSIELRCWNSSTQALQDADFLDFAGFGDQ